MLATGGVCYIIREPHVVLLRRNLLEEEDMQADRKNRTRRSVRGETKSFQLLLRVAVHLHSKVVRRWGAARVYYRWPFQTRCPSVIITPISVLHPNSTRTMAAIELRTQILKYLLRVGEDVDLGIAPIDIRSHLEPFVEPSVVASDLLYGHDRSNFRMSTSTHLAALSQPDRPPYAQDGALPNLP